MSVSLISTICILFCAGALASAPCDPGYVHIFGEGCQICPPGTMDDGNGYCSPCHRDTFQPHAGQTECNACPAGTNSFWGATTCVSCPERYGLTDNHTCITCPAGEFFDNSGPSYQILGRYCSPCSVGFFKAGEGIHPCLPCPRNSYSRMADSECTACPEGTALMADGSCDICPPGKYYEPDALICVDCHPGLYTDSPNVLRSCNQCGGNSFSALGSTECIECPIGKVFVRSSGTCQICEPGQFYDDYELSCNDCPYNEFSVYENERSCIGCHEGSFARKRSTTCFACPHGQVYIAQEDECGQCPPGAYYDSSEAKCVSNI